MDSMAQLAVLAAATVLAAGVAFGMAWAFLQGTFRLMQPAAVTKTQVQKGNLGHQQRPRLELVQGTRAVARHFVRG
jgi:hypothetical protein